MRRHGKINIEPRHLLFIFILFALIVFLINFQQPTYRNVAKEGITANSINESKVLTVRDIFKCGNNTTCMDSISQSMMKVRSAKELLAELDELGKGDSQILLQCHPIAHSIGRMLYKKLSDESKHVADVFQQCDHTCHSGCFHGAMERVFFAGESGGEDHVTPQILREKVPTVCKDFAPQSYGNLKFQCLHGLGHAVVFFNNYNLTDSLKICDLLASDWDSFSCYGGAFMENVAALDKSKRVLNDDPHFPCNAIEEKYRSSCYMMQTSRMLELGFSYEKIGNECENVGTYRNTCMQSLGRDASNDARKDPKSAPICVQLQTEMDKQFCMMGLVYALSDNSWDGRYAFPYCDNLPINYTSFCYRTTITYFVHSIFINKSAVMKSCETYSSYPNCGSIANSG